MFVREIKNSDELKTRIENDKFLSTVNSELIQRGEALLTFRNNNATIYYKGRRLCNMPLKAKDGSNTLPNYSPTIFNNFLPVLRSTTLRKSKKKPYYEAQYIRATNNTCDFTATLPEILDNLKMDEDPESLSVSAFYKFSPMVNSNNSDVILLDIEAEFAERNLNTNKTEANRIDIVLYNTKTKKLVFVEVKRLTDTRLYPKNAQEAEIMEQMRSYRTILKDQAVHIKKAV